MTNYAHNEVTVVVRRACYDGAGSTSGTHSRSRTICRIACDGDAVVLESPSFLFRLDTADGLRATAWTNRQTGRQLLLGNGPEVEFDIGLPDKPDDAETASDEEARRSQRLAL